MNRIQYIRASNDWLQEYSGESVGLFDLIQVSQNIALRLNNQKKAIEVYHRIDTGDGEMVPKITYWEMLYAAIQPCADCTNVLDVVYLSQNQYDDLYTMIAYFWSDITPDQPKPRRRSQRIRWRDLGTDRETQIMTGQTSPIGDEW